MDLLRSITTGLVLTLSLGVAPAADLRLTTYNIEHLDEAGGPSYRALIEILERIDADVVMLQEPRVFHRLITSVRTSPSR